MHTSKKKMIPSMILDILRRRTDENHTLDQKDILDELNKSFDPPLDRKTVRRNIEYLLEIGCPIAYTETPRSNGNDVWTDFYLAREFTEAELRLLIDGLLFSNHVPYKRCQELIEKLEGLSSEHFKSYVKHIKTLPDTEIYNKQLFYTIQILDEAISNERQVSFHYVNYGTDKKNHPKLGEDGKPKDYIINPYQMVLDGKNYLENLLLGRSDVERCLRLNEDENCVHMANLHKVKGLEAPVIILALAQSGPINPSIRIQYNDDSVEGHIFELDKENKDEHKSKRRNFNGDVFL